MIEDFFYKVLELKSVARQGWKEKLEIDNSESVADHSYSVTVMSKILSDLEGLDTSKIIRMALLHDLAESVTGDIIPNTMEKNEKIKKENLAMKKILKNLPDEIAESYVKIWNEYQEKYSEEAILLHDIDKLEMIFQAKFYENEGIPKKKLQTFFNATKEVENKNLRKIISKLID